MRGQIPLHDRDVVAHERQWVVNFIHHAGHHLPQAGKLFGLDQLALGAFNVS